LPLASYQPPASIPSANSRRALLRARWAISCPTAMTTATGHSMTSSSAISVSPAYQASCSGVCAPGTDARRGLALRRLTLRTTGTRPFVGCAGWAVGVIDILRLVVATSGSVSQRSSGFMAQQASVHLRVRGGGASGYRVALNPSSSGGSAALRWIQNVIRPAEAAPQASHEFDDTKPSSAGLTRWRSGPR
jgi:hypothetical protein